MSAAADRGSVTAEFVAAIPAVLATAALLLGGVHVGSATVAAQSAAASAAREVARGEDPAAVVARVGGRMPGARVTRRTADGLECVRVSVPAPGPLGAAGVWATAEACAVAS